MTVLEEAHHSIIIVEHDPMLYEDAAEMIEYVSRASSDAAKESAVMLYSPGFDPFLEELAKNADRLWYFRRRAESITKACLKGFSEGRKEPDHSGGVLMIKLS